VAAYVPLFVLALGASAGQLGLMSSLSNLSAAVLLLPGALIAERWGNRKGICLWSAGVVGRLVLLLLAITPLFFSGRTAIFVAIALIVTRTALNNLTLPAGTSLTADIVPLSWRGRYFSSRNVVMGVSGMILTFVVGGVITRVGAPTGYQWALVLAFIVGLAATSSFSRINEPPMPARPRVGSSSRIPLLENLRSQPDFMAFCAVAGLWNLSLNTAGPFFSVHFVRGLDASAGSWGLISVAHGLAALPGQRLWGILADRWGPRRVQLITGLGIPFIPWLWGLSRSVWQLVPVETVSGFLWAGYALASFNFLLTLTPEDRRARYAALYQIVVTVSLALGAALGGLVATWFGYQATFLLSGLGRLAAALLFLRFVRESEPVRQF
jgi:MFS family permease